MRLIIRLRRTELGRIAGNGLSIYSSFNKLGLRYHGSSGLSTPNLILDTIFLCVPSLAPERAMAFILLLWSPAAPAWPGGMARG